MTQTEKHIWLIDTIRRAGRDSLRISALLGRKSLRFSAFFILFLWKLEFHSYFAQNKIINDGRKNI